MTPTENATLFDRLVWKPDRVLLDDLVFRLQHFLSEEWDLGDNCFVFMKDKKLVDQYATFFAQRPAFSADRVLELGIWDGGSLAFWFEHFQPRKLVGVDLTNRTDSAYFERYAVRPGVSGRISTYWGTDQADAGAVRHICSKEFDGPLDVVIDDASHLLGPTRASFENLFPLLRPGGLYLVEDWAWLHWSDFAPPGWTSKEAPTPFIHQLVDATGTLDSMIGQVTVTRGFVAVERSDVQRPSTALRLEEEIFRGHWTTPALTTAARRLPTPVQDGLKRVLRRRSNGR